MHSIFHNFARLSATLAVMAGGVCTAAAVHAQDASGFDPFATEAPRKAPASSVSTSLDLLYQGNYLPGVISDGGRDRAEQDLFADYAINWRASADAALGARLIGNREQRQTGSAHSHRNDLSALEYFYRQQFAEGGQAFTLGRKVMDWSAGFQWRPANLIDNGFSTKNIDIQDPYRYQGINQLRYELIASSFDAVAIASNDKRGFFGGHQYAVKLGFKSVVDIALVASRNGDYARKLGLLVDTSLPWGTTLAIEAVHVNVNRARLADGAHFGRTLESLSGIHRYQDVYVSLTKFIDARQRVSAEYFHNGRGLEDAAGRRPAPAPAPAADPQPAIDPSLFSQQYLGRNYVYLAYTGYLDAWRLQYKPSLMINTGDGSSITAFSVKRELGARSELTLNVNTFHGGTASEFGAVTNGVGASVSYVFHFF